MEKYAPNKMELASRDVVSRAEQTEINEGRGFPDGSVHLDVTVVPKKRIHEALRETVRWYLEHPEWVQAVAQQPDYQGWIQKNYTNRAEGVK